MDDVELQRRIGTVLCGKWTLERLLGSGGMAAVYVGVHKIGRRDAIKILHPEIARMPELRARFEQEAQAVNRFVHPMAVEIRDIDTTADGCPFLVMELLEGESLKERAARLGTLPTSEILGLVDDLLDVLAAAHAHGIIHRDIKPDNLFCLRDGGLKVLDFGVARVRQAAAQTTLTRTGVTLGTVAYMPPEQVKGMDIDARADIFAVGATMFRLIAKRRIHEARTDNELIVKMATMPAPPLASVAPQTPPAVCAIVDRALAFERDERYPTATAMQQDIRRAREGTARAVVVGDQTDPVPISAHEMSVHSLGTAATVAAPSLVAAWAAKTVAAPSAHPALAPAALDASAPAQGTPREPSRAASPAAPTVVAAGAAPMAATPARQRTFHWLAVALPSLALVALAALAVRALYGASDKTPSDASSAVEPSAAPRSSADAPSIASGGALRLPGNLVGRVGQRRPRRESCIDRDECDYVCAGPCNVACTGSNTCAIGARSGSKVTCSGSATCEVWCSGACEVDCASDAPCVAHCTPGFACDIAECSQPTQNCADDAIVCGIACPN